MLIWVNQRLRSKTEQKKKPKSQQKSSPNPIQHQSSIQQKNSTRPNQAISETSITKISLSHKISKKEAKKLLQIFRTYDEDEDGFLSFSELHKLMCEGGQSINLTTSKNILADIEKYTKVSISFQHFVEIIFRKDYSMDTFEQLQQVFNTFDKKKGYFNFQDYLTVWRTTSRSEDLDSLKQAFDLMDANRDGVITFQEFKQAVSPHS